MADLQKIAEDLSSLSVLEAAELSKILEDKWGVSAAAAAALWLLHLEASVETLDLQLRQKRNLMFI